MSRKRPGLKYSKDNDFPVKAHDQLMHFIFVLKVYLRTCLTVQSGNINIRMHLCLNKLMD